MTWKIPVGNRIARQTDCFYCPRPQIPKKTHRKTTHEPTPVFPNSTRPTPFRFITGYDTFLLTFCRGSKQAVQGGFGGTGSDVKYVILFIHFFSSSARRFLSCQFTLFRRGGNVRRKSFFCEIKCCFSCFHMTRVCNVRAVSERYGGVIWKKSGMFRLICFVLYSIKNRVSFFISTNSRTCVVGTSFIRID